MINSLFVKKGRGHAKCIYGMSAVCQERYACNFTESASLMRSVLWPHFTDREKAAQEVQVTCHKLQVVKWLN